MTSSTGICYINEGDAFHVYWKLPEHSWECTSSAGTSFANEHKAIHVILFLVRVRL